jgi:hypothetical protein
MAQQVFVIGDTGRVAIPDFVRGGRVKTLPSSRRPSEESIMADALYWSRRGQMERAEAVLEEGLRALGN